ncbi:hemagglutinin, partial [Escherichia coli]
GVISPVPENNRWWGVVRHDGVEYLAVYWGEGATVPDEYRIRTGDTETVTVSASGHAARISGGADMHIRAGRLDNEASFILAGGSMTLSGDILNNHGWQEG